MSSYDFTALRKRVNDPKALDALIAATAGADPSPTHLMWKAMWQAERVGADNQPGHATDAERFEAMALHDIVVCIADVFRHCGAEYRMMDFRLRIGENQRRLGL